MRVTLCCSRTRPRVSSLESARHPTMRAWNVTAPANQRVQFLGFDMQYPGAAIDSVAAFIGRVHPPRSSAVSANYACLVPYRNNGPTFTSAATQYAALSASTKAACAAGLQQVYSLIDSAGIEYTAASSPTKYESIKHNARLVQQFEAMASISDANASSNSRDQSMAEKSDGSAIRRRPERESFSGRTTDISTASSRRWAHTSPPATIPTTLISDSPLGMAISTRSARTPRNEAVAADRQYAGRKELVVPPWCHPKRLACRKTRMAQSLTDCAIDI